MQRNAIARLFVVALPFFLGGCLTTTIGTASCTGGGAMCGVKHATAGAEILFKGAACAEVCRVASDCDGRVQATVRHKPVAAEAGGSRVVNVSPGDVSAQCVGATLPTPG